MQKQQGFFLPFDAMLQFFVHGRESSCKTTSAPRDSAVHSDIDGHEAHDCICACCRHPLHKNDDRYMAFDQTFCSHRCRSLAMTEAHTPYRKWKAQQV